MYIKYVLLIPGNVRDVAYFHMRKHVRLETWCNNADGVDGRLELQVTHIQALGEHILTGLVILNGILHTIQSLVHTEEHFITMFNIHCSDIFVSIKVMYSYFLTVYRAIKSHKFNRQQTAIYLGFF
jgi:hypothetical protein